MIRQQPLHDASSEQLARWLAEALAARGCLLPDDTPASRATDTAWLDHLTAAIRAEMARRGQSQRPTGTDS